VRLERRKKEDEMKSRILTVVLALLLALTGCPTPGGGPDLPVQLSATVTFDMVGIPTSGGPYAVTTGGTLIVTPSNDAVYDIRYSHDGSSFTAWQPDMYSTSPNTFVSQGGSYEINIHVHKDGNYTSVDYTVLLTAAP
jgi:hypothetical protein